MPESIYCANQQSLARAIAAVRTAGCVMDCEGLELGDAQGRLTLIQIIPVTQPAVSFLVDIQELEQQQASLEALKQLLLDPSVTKVFYDCRNDAAALWYEQQCQLQVRNKRPNVYVQLATLASLAACFAVWAGLYVQLAMLAPTEYFSSLHNVPYARYPRAGSTSTCLLTLKVPGRNSQ
jgi:hypothetical protein